MILTAADRARLATRIQAGPDGCWLWTGYTDRGYAKAGAQGRCVRVHRAIYETLVGPVPDGLQLDHLCRVRHCVNPWHLEPVTHAENHARIPAPTRCPQGHEYTESNTQWTHGHRRCAECNRRNANAYYARKKAAA